MKENFHFGYLRDKLMKMAAFGLVAVSGIIFLAMISHNSDDPSWNNATSNETHNIIGSFGAHLSDMLWQFFGLAGFLVCLLLVMWAYRIYQGFFISKFWLRSLTSVLAITATAAVASGVFDFGGVFGDFIKRQLYLELTDPIYNTIFIAAAIFLTHFSSGLKLREERELYQKASEPVEKVAGIVQRKVSAMMRKKEIEREREERKEPSVAEYAKRIAKPASAPQTAAAKPKAQQPKQASLELGLEGDFELPSTDFLTSSPQRLVTARMSESALSQNAKILEGVLADFSVKGEITRISPGPVVTLYEFQPQAGTKSQRVIGLADDIARSMSAVSARIAVIPGQNAIGIELPNSKRDTVYFREMMEAREYTNGSFKLPLALGKDIGGTPVVTDLAKMPHLLVAGTTGSGKSVAINTMILSLLYSMPPSKCKFIMIDPKMLELSVYDGIPHLLAPVVTEPGKAVVALKWVVKEMENRYRLMSTMGVRNIDGFNERMEDAIRKGEKLSRQVQTGYDPETGRPIVETIPIATEKFPYIVVIVDEMADLMVVAGKDIEGSIQRLAQMARAAGIHIIMATQRPSVDVITGVIKANFPTRISFQVTSKIDSRTILGEQGAEQLLGQGDMLYMAGGGRVSRVHGAFVDEREVEKIVKFLKSQGAPAYVDDVTREEPEDGEITSGMMGEDASLYDQAVQIVLRDKRVSTSYIQRRLRIGYNKAASLIEEMEQQGVVSAPNHSGKREILVREGAA